MKKRRLLLFKLLGLFMVFSLLGVTTALAQPKKASSDEIDIVKKKIQTHGVTPALNQNMVATPQVLQFGNDVKATLLNEGFESAIPPTGWSTNYAGTGFESTTARVNSGTYAIYHDDSDVDNSDWLITPAIDLSGTSGPILKYFENVNYSSWAETHEVYVSTNADMSGATLLRSDLGTEDVWQEVELSLAAYAGSTVYVGFYYVGYYASEWYLDDVTVVEPTAYDFTLSVPNGVSIMNGQSYNYAYTIANKGSQNDEYQISLSSGDPRFTYQLLQADGVTPITGNVSVSTGSSVMVYLKVTTNPYAGEVADTRTLTVKSVGDATLSLTHNLTTSTYNAVLAEGFEGGTLPAGWLNIDADGDGYKWVPYTFSPNSGLYSFASASWINPSPVTPDNWLISPATSITQSGTKLTYWVAAQDPDYPADKYGVYVSTTNTNPSSFEEVFVETLSSDVWKKITIDLADYVGNTIYIAFRHYDSYDNFMFKIDDIKVSAPIIANLIYQYSFKDINDVTVINQDAKTIKVEVPFGTNVSSLVAEFGLTALNSVAKVSGVTQTSGVTVNNFTNPVIYAVSTSAGLTRNYTVSVSKIDPLVSLGLQGQLDSYIENDTVYVYVEANQDLDAQTIMFQLTDGTYKLMDGTTELQSAVSVINVAEPKTVTVQAGDYTKNYVIVAQTEAPLYAYRFIGYLDANDEAHSLNVWSSIDQETKKVSLEVPYGVPTNKLVAMYYAADYVSSVAFNGDAVTTSVALDYSNGGELVLSLNDPAKADPISYTIEVTENVGSFANEILSVSVPNLTAPLAWDRYGRTITGYIAYDSSLVIKPYFAISSKATIVDTTQAFDFADGPVTYTVTSENGLAVAEWKLILMEAAPSTEAEITSFIHNDQYDYWMEDGVVYSIANPGFDLAEVKVELTTSFGATVDASMVSPSVLDFTEQPVVFTVTAQDQTTKVDYPAFIAAFEGNAPVVSVTKGLYSNADGSIPVKVVDEANAFGLDLALVHNSIVADFYDIMNDDAAFEQAVAKGEIYYTMIEPGSTDSLFTIPALGLKPGYFYAIAGDLFGNISEFSADSAVVGIDTIAVTKLADMTIFNNVIYKYTGEAVVTFAQPTFRHQKFVQDESAGILIDDNSGFVSDTVVAGDVITGIYGKLINYYNTIEFQPIAITADEAEIVERGVTVEPIELTFEEFNSDLFENQNMLVKITNAKFDDADNSNYFTNGVIYGMTNAADGAAAKFRTTFYGVDYIGSIIPSDVYDIVGIKNIRNNAPVMTARNMADFSKVTGYKFAIDPMAWSPVIVSSGSDAKVFTISNSGVESLTIADIYIEGAPEFSVPVIKDVVVDAFDAFQFTVSFEPANMGTYASTLIVKLSDGTVKNVALNGSVITAPVYSYPYASDFNTESAIAGWSVENYGAGAGFSWGYPTATAPSPMFYRVGYNNPSFPSTEDAMLISPAIDMTNALAPKVKWTNFLTNPTYSTTALFVSIGDTESWQLVGMIETASGAYVPLDFDVSIANGNSKVYFGFYMFEDEYGAGSPISWWRIDDFSVSESPTAPMFDISATSVNFGAVDGIASKAVTVSNIGVSYYTLNSVTLKTGSSAAFTLSNVPAQATDVYENDVVFNVNFDGTVGENAGTVVVNYTDPRQGEMEIELPVSAIGVDCSAPLALAEGSNEAPYAPAWYEYTPTEDVLITISSCGDAVDTDLKVFAGCDGKVVAANDDNANCTDNEYSSEVVFAGKSGVTYKINWLATWQADGFNWMFDVQPLPVGPELVSVIAQSRTSDSAQAILSFNAMYQIDPDTKGAFGAVDGKNVKFNNVKLNATEFEILPVVATKDFTPDGTPEVEPNNGPSSVGGDDTFQEIELGTADAPTKITGLVGTTTDPWDWFEITLTEPTYLHANAEIAAGRIYLWVINSALSGTRIDGLPGTVIAAEPTDLKEPGTYYVIVQRRVVVADPGFAYNLKVWGTQPPKFSIYRDMYKIASAPMAFAYTDNNILMDKEYCYSVTQEKQDGTESGYSNSICVKATAGPGDICVKAKPVVVGLNEAPRTPYWYQYTSTATTGLKITSNIPENGDPVKDWNDTWLFVYESCDGQPLYESDDVENGVIRTSELDFVAEGGKTYLINWRRWAAEGENNAYNSEPFFFNVIESELKEGEYVGNAIPLTLPVVDMDGTTSGFAHNYSSTPCNVSFLDGNDVCYTFEVPYGGSITGSITGEYVGMFVIKGTPESGSCVASAAGATGGSFSNKALTPGTYSIIVSTQKPTMETDFVMNLSYTTAPKQTVTFNVDMNNQIKLGKFNKTADKVNITGTFNNWATNVELTDADDNGIYTYALDKEYFVGEKIQYKYLVNGDWEKAEFSNEYSNNREYFVKTSGNTTNDVFNNEELPRYSVKFQVQMARQVELGNFKPETDVLKLELSLISALQTPKDPAGIYLYEYSIANVKYGDITFKYQINGVPETVSRSAKIVSDTVITVWYNNDNKVNVDSDLAAAIEIYPNPANDKFTISLGATDYGKAQLSIVNIEGKVMKVIDVENQASVLVPTTEFAKGVYYIKISNNDQFIVRKLVIE